MAKQKIKKIVFVCTGNTCRSPMAEAAFSAEIKRKSLPAVATSAGLNVSPTERDMNEKAAKTLENTGLMLPYFSSTSLTKETLLSADIVLCMTRAQSELLKPARKRFLEEAGKQSAKNNVFYATLRVCMCFRASPKNDFRRFLPFSGDFHKPSMSISKFFINCFTDHPDTPACGRFLLKLSTWLYTNQ